jgi:glucose-1-phosphate thymidylyltransferase
MRTTFSGRIGTGFIIGEILLAMMLYVWVLGDNIFYGQGFPAMLQKAVKDAEKEGIQPSRL